VYQALSVPYTPSAQCPIDSMQRMCHSRVTRLAIGMLGHRLSLLLSLHLQA